MLMGRILRPINIVRQSALLSEQEKYLSGLSAQVDCSCRLKSPICILRLSLYMLYVLWKSGKTSVFHKPRFFAPQGGYFIVPESAKRYSVDLRRACSSFLWDCWPNWAWRDEKNLSDLRKTGFGYICLIWKSAHLVNRSCQHSQDPWAVTWHC